MPPNVQTLIELQSGWRHILLTHARHPNMNSEMQAKKPRNKQTSERTSGWRCPITKHTLQILLLGSNHMQSPKNHQKNAESGPKGGQECCELHPTANKQKITSLVKAQGTVGWKMKPTKKTDSNWNAQVFQVFHITRFSVGKTPTFENSLKIRARSRCSPQCGAGTCNTSCTGSAKYLTQALAKEPRCTRTLRSQNKDPA